MDVWKSLVRFAHSWDILVNTRNKFHSYAHTCIILYIFPEPRSGEVNITIITETEVTNCFRKFQTLRGISNKFLTDIFNCGTSIMQVNLMQCHLPNSLKLSSRFDSFQKYTYSQTWPKNINNFMTKHFLTFRQFYLRAFRCVQSLSVKFFDDLLSLKI